MIGRSVVGEHKHSTCTTEVSQHQTDFYIVDGICQFDAMHAGVGEDERLPRTSLEDNQGFGKKESA
ncbi:hypothetical protein EUX98_g2639 [Antrodiella citrinella]|uniref:Uncharacterized protein n=1 Tax=Antrodiella citrinella TaxID=2447956 RepID=A0A4S4N0M6_9APHY|nr:hypothetical protein EUX98_g2639 [Antrodiella citrinella]